MNYSNRFKELEPPINKKRCLELLESGLVGNTMNTQKLELTSTSLYVSYVDAIAKMLNKLGPNSEIALRCFNKPGVELPYYCKSVGGADELYNRVLKVWVHEYGINPNDIVIYETLPFSNLIYNCEYGDYGNGKRTLRVNAHPCILRDAMRRSDCRNIESYAEQIAMVATWANDDYDQLFRQILDAWSNTIIEFSITNNVCGVLKHNVVVWEVRTGY